MTGVSFDGDNVVCDRDEHFGSFQLSVTVLSAMGKTLDEKSSIARHEVICTVTDAGCHDRAADLFGLGTDSIRWIAVDGSQRIDPEVLRRQLAADRAAGHVPFLLVGNAGPVGTGLLVMLALCALLPLPYLLLVMPARARRRRLYRAAVVRPACMVVGQNGEPELLVGAPLGDPAALRQLLQRAAAPRELQFVLVDGRDHETGRAHRPPDDFWGEGTRSLCAAVGAST